MKRRELVECLELVRPALADSELIPMFNNLCFSGKTIKAYNDSLGISALVPDELTDAGFGIHGRTVIELLKNSKAVDVTFEFAGDDVLVKAGRSKIKLPFMTEEELLFAEAAPDDKWPVVIDLTEEFLNGVAACLLTASRDNTQPAIMGVTISLKHKALFSCDGDAISRYALPELTGNDGSFTIPNEFCDNLLRITAKTGNKEGKVYVNDEWAVAELPSGYTIYGRVVTASERFDYAALIKKTLNSDPKFVPVPKGMAEGLARALVMAPKGTLPTKATVTPSRLTLATDGAAGALRDLFKISDKHPDIEALLSAQAVQRSLGVCSQLALLENCSAYTDGKNLFCLISNLGE